jgi:hypothetical protein
MFPQDIISRINEYCDFDDIAQLIKVSKQFNQEFKHLYMFAYGYNPNILYTQKYYTNIITFRVMNNKLIKDADLIRLTHLRSLNLTNNCNITDNGIKQLKQLEELELADSMISDEGIMGLTNLRKLDLKYTYTISNKGIKNLVNLVHLNLTFNNLISNEGLKPLVNLTSLNLTENDTITNSGLKHLVKLRKLKLVRNTTITEEGYAHIPHCKIIR